ncbi:hypothetical protein BH09PAT2_BH09PAT2_08310 [soil metagenome]
MISSYIKKYRRLIFAILILPIGITLFYFYKRTPSPQNLLSKIEKHILLPVNESPAIATVSDKTKLANQQFFSEAQNGDVLLIYNTSQKAILYRPSIDKIVNVTAVNIHTSAPTQSPNPSITLQDVSKAPLKVAIYNGTQIAGLASKVEKQLKQQFPNITVVTKSNTTGSYTENLIVDLTGTRKTEANNLATLMKGTVSTLPKSEIKLASDILIIVGKDFQ